jgi:hypothetical protein
MTEADGNIVYRDFKRRAEAAQAKAFDPKPVETGGGGHDSGGMDGLHGLEVRVGKVETAIEGLRHAQTIVLGVLGLGFSALLGLMIYFGQDIGGEVRDINVRLDRFLERQADTAAAANQRMDRLLEQRAVASPAPIIIQLPPPAAQP